MVQAYRIDAVLNLKSNAMTELRDIGRQFQAFDNIIQGSTTKIQAFGNALASVGTGRKLSGLVSALTRLGQIHVGNMAGLSQLSHLNNISAANVASIGKIASGLNKIGTTNYANSIQNLATMTTHLGAMAGHQTTIAHGAQQTATAWQAAAQAIRQAATGMRGVRQPGGGGGGGGGGGAGRSGGHQGGYGPSSGERAFERDVNEVGGAASGFAHGVWSLGKEVLGAGMETQSAAGGVGAMMGGLSDAELDRIKKRAYEVQQTTPGASVVKTIDEIKEIAMVTRNLDFALTHAQDIAKFGIVMETVSGKDNAVKETLSGILGAEERGMMVPGTDTIDPNRLLKKLHQDMKVAIGTGGRDMPTNSLGELRALGPEAKMMSDEEWSVTEPAIAIGMKDSKAGNALFSMTQSLTSSIPKRIGDVLMASGIYQGKMTPLKGGNYKPDIEKFAPGPNGEIDWMQTHPSHWTHDVAYQKLLAWERRKDKNAPEERIEARAQTDFNMVFSRGTIIRRAQQVVAAWGAILKEEEALKEGGALDRMDAYKYFLSKNPKVSLKATEEAAIGAKSAFGEASMGSTIGILDKVTTSLNKLSQWALSDPGSAERIEKVASGLGVLALGIAGLSAVITIASPALRLLSTPAFLAAAAGGGIGLLLAHFFPKNHPPGEVSRADQILKGIGADPNDLVGSLQRLLGEKGTIERLKELGGAPPSGSTANTPGASSSNPLYTYQLNQPSGRDIANGTTDFMGRRLSGPPASQTGTDGRSVPNFSYMPLPQ
jgi:hypothetical protein